MKLEYAELHALSNFSFQRGASMPQELVKQAHALGYEAIAVTDECSLAGIVRAWEESKETGLKLIVGSEFQLERGPKLVLLAPDVAAYSQLCSLITRGRRNNAKGQYRLVLDDLDECRDLLALWIPRWSAQGLGEAQFSDEIEALRERFAGRLRLAWERHLHPQDRERLALMQRLGKRYGLPLVAAGDVHYHAAERQRLQDVMACIRAHCSLRDPQAPLFPNAERRLRPLDALQRLYPPELLRETVEVAKRCTFNFDQLKYDYPHELVPPGLDAPQHLRNLTEAGIRWRWPDGIPAKHRESVEKELALITKLKYENYFLTVEDIMRWAKAQGILCQGRGSAANSVVCYALGITEISPERIDLLFERFISEERGEPPDIDIDFEHQRREEVIQYIYRKYGRERAAIAATVISYRRRSAMRDVGKVLGLSLDQVDALAKAHAWWDKPEQLRQRLVAMGFELDGVLLDNFMKLVGEIEGMPRHLSQHVGGFVISHHPLHTLVPVENAAMPERTIIQWDKDDLDAVRLFKVDVLALGMLSALREAFKLISRYECKPFNMSSVPAKSRKTYRMIRRADTIGTFQIESRAQMSMLPRLRPRNFFDLVIQIAIVRPGPIQGDMVHPYLRRRQKLEEPDYMKPELKQILRRTLGIPLFQEQVMGIAIKAAGFSPGKADEVRRSMAAWKRTGGLEKYKPDLIQGMLDNEYTEQFANQIYKQILGFGSYGFPQSHSASFALLAWVSCWLKCRRPAAFCAALLNSQPLGFYAPAQLINDARRHGVRFHPVDVQISDRDCTLERGENGHPAVRLGLRLINGFSEEDSKKLLMARAIRPFSSIEDLSNRTGLNSRPLAALAQAGALEPLSGHRHAAHWEVAGVQRLNEVLNGSTVIESQIILPAPTEGQALVADYRSLGLTLGRHPMVLLRRKMSRQGVVTAEKLRQMPNGRSVRVAGIVTHRQRPGTASGVVFVTLEDETGSTNLIVWRSIVDSQRDALLSSRLMIVEGELQHADNVTNVVVRRIGNYTHWLGELETSSRDFH
ncbi:MAG TPA: error-prone DNA polymerase [Terriglobales bacterium]|nr:error-prone DNA polymerase [Terriglobales bacterium]